MQNRNEFGNPIVIDTHVLIWSLLTPEKITPEQHTAIKSALSKNELYISSITLWEIAMLVRRGRINIFSRIDDLLKLIENIKGLNIYQITGSVAADSVALPGNIHSDPADHLIIATCRELSATLITYDQAILDWSKEGYIKVLI